MRRLILMRHAEAAVSSGQGDRARPLTARGREDARAMGERLAALGLSPDLALVSDARRTRETWEAVSDALGDVVTEYAAEAYEADESVLRGLVEDAEDRCGGLILIAHNPGLHQLAYSLMVEQAASPSTLERLSDGFPPGSAAVFTVDAAGRATYEAYLRPGETR